MAVFLYRSGRWAFRRRRLVTLLWLAALAAVAAGMAAGSGSASTSFTVPGTEAQKAFDLLDERFPGMTADGASARVVFRAPRGQKITSAGNQAAVGAVITALKTGSRQVASVSAPLAAPDTVSRDATTAFAQVSYKAQGSKLTDATRNALKSAARAGRAAGLTVEIGGDALVPAPQVVGPTEVIGVIAAAVVLLVTLGSPVAAGLPLLTALAGVSISLAGVAALSGALGLDITTPILAMMIGLAVGIDYALFIVARYRAERTGCRTAEEAAGLAVGTAGSAVVFAGLTVVIALGGLAVVNLPVLTKMGLAASAAVALAVALSVTLLPALLGFAGDRVPGRSGAAGNGAAASDTAGAPEPAPGVRWVRFIMRRPRAALLTTAVVLSVIAIPAGGLRLGLPDDGAQPTAATQRRAYDMLADSFGPGFNGPLLVVLDTAHGTAPRQVVQRIADSLKGLKGVAATTPAAFNPTGDTASMTVIPATAPSRQGTLDLVERIRADIARHAAAKRIDVLVTGQTAMNIDVSQRIQDALPPYLALVVGLAFLLLIVIFRSILVPLKAALGFLLSVLASFGVVVAVFQWGWAAGPLGVEQAGPIMSLIPILLVGIVFGLAMDYEVFLLSRIREAHVHGAAPREAIETGFAHGARVVGAAAIIMISVFAGFVGSHATAIKTIGLGLVAAVLFDAFIVRMTLVPAVLTLLDRKAWWLPRRLDRALPRVDVEGEALRTAASDGTHCRSGPGEPAEGFA